MDQVNKKEVSENLLEFYSFLSAAGWIFLVISALFMIYIKFSSGIFDPTDKISLIFLAIYFSGFCFNVISFLSGAVKTNQKMVFLSSSCLISYFIYMLIFFKIYIWPELRQFFISFSSFLHHRSIPDFWSYDTFFIFFNAAVYLFWIWKIIF